MPKTKLEIVLDGEAKKYFPGEHVVGKVRVTTFFKIKVKVLTIKVEGSSSVSGGNAAKGKTDSPQNADSNVHFYNDLYDLLGKDSTSNISTLPEGEHNFSFRYQIPEDVPSTFHSSNGSVKHSCEATLIPKTLYGSKIKCSISLDVVAKVDLNLHNSMLTPPWKFEKALVKNTVFRKGGSVSAQLKLNRSGFVPEEVIVINADVINQAKRTLAETKITLLQTVTYKADDHQLTVNNQINSMSKKHSEAESVKWIDESLSIPDIPPSNLQPNHLINIQYSVKFEVIPKHSSFTLEVAIPITIGSVPFASEVSSTTSCRDTDKSNSNPSPYAGISPMRPTPLIKPGKLNESPVVGAAALLPQTSTAPTAPPITPELGPPPKYEDIAF